MNSVNQLLAFKDINYYLQPNNSQTSAGKARSAKNGAILNQQSMNYPLVNKTNYSMFNNGNLHQNNQQQQQQQQPVVNPSRNSQRPNGVDFKRYN